MTTFLRLLTEKDKALALLTACTRWRLGEDEPRCFDVAPDAFDAVPGKPFAYWVSEAVRETFRRLPAFESDGRTVKQGLATADDFRFVRGWWEAPSSPALLPEGEGSESPSPTGRGVGVREHRWFPFAKGGAYSPFYADVYLMVNWVGDGLELDTFAGSVIRNPDFYLRPGLTWPRRTNGLSFRAMPAGCIFADKGPAAFIANDDPDTLLALSALLNSRAFGLLVAVQLARTELAQSYEVGLIQQTPIPPPPSALRLLLTDKARRAWSLKRRLDSINETSHAFLLPAALRALTPTPLPVGEGLLLPSPCGRRAGDEGDYDPPAIEAELARIQAGIDAIAFDLYGFAEADRVGRISDSASAETQALGDALRSSPLPAGEDEDEDSVEPAVPPVDALRSWAVGVAFGRFDWRLATGERTAPPEPDPFDPLPAKSPGMLPHGASSFHAHPGILVDDQGHPHDLPHLIEEVLARVAVAAPDYVRRWLQKDFFAFHLQRYSKSRRKAPIYWPLATASGSYTLWLYYPSLSNQTLYTAINDFVEPKLKQVGDDVTALRNKGAARTRDDERQFETLQAFELELIELRDTLLGIAQGYQPNHDDGVQITAAPLWPLFRHKPWQKVLKDTWAKLEKGDYDWAHLGLNYWPARVREKCKAGLAEVNAKFSTGPPACARSARPTNHWPSPMTWKRCTSSQKRNRRKRAARKIQEIVYEPSTQNSQAGHSPN